MSILHVANGHATTGLIELSGLPGRTEIWADPLNEGPVPGNVSDDELLHVRARFLASHPMTPMTSPPICAGGATPLTTPTRYDELVLWFEHDLFDQLNLIQLLAHLGGTAAIETDHAGLHRSVSRPSELQGPRRAGACATSQRLFDDAAAGRTRRSSRWRRGRGRRIDRPTRARSRRCSQADTSALPFLARALARHLEEFPSDADGLSRSERRLMEQAIGGPGRSPRRVSRGCTTARPRYYIADSWFVDRAHELASASPALVDLSITADAAERAAGRHDRADARRAARCLAARPIA